MSFIFIDHRHRPYLVHAGWLHYRNADHNWVTLRQVKDREFEDQALPVSLALQYDMPESIREKIAARKEGK